jgi:enamine deaminase RidA (YjgF/YER057c/UK114 family)
MGLLQNIRVLNAEPIRHGAGGTAGSIPVATCVDRAHFNRPEQKWKFCIGEGGMSQSRGFPYGPSVPYQINLPLKDGGDPTYPSLEASVVGEGSFTISNPTFPSSFSADVTGSGTISSSNLELTVALAASLVGQGDLTGAADLIVSLAADLSGSGTISSATLESIAQLSANISGGGDITQATMNCIAHLTSDITGYGGITATMKCICSMEANITSAGDLVTAQSCAQAVWSAVAAQYMEMGTMGYAVSAGGDGGGGWGVPLHNVYPEGSAGYMLDRIYYKKDILKRS